ncbi:hypothetical protein BZA77DRAFT_24376 [Pyronema omphalodes]|nr:hypothetical protein BZA77DRAFT_24376 [Pyronema omphalodes]
MFHRKPSYFVSAQGFEKRYFANNFRKYFGEDVKWWDSVETETGLEGFEVESSLQHHLRIAIIERMRADSQREFQRWLHSLSPPPFSKHAKPYANTSSTDRQDTVLYVDTHFMDSAVGLSSHEAHDSRRLLAPPHTNSPPGRRFHSTPASPRERPPARDVLSPPNLNRHHSDTLQSQEMEPETSIVPYHRVNPLSVSIEEATPRPSRTNRLSGIFSFPKPSESRTR